MSHADPDVVPERLDDVYPGCVLLSRFRPALYAFGLFCLFLHRWDDSLAWPSPYMFGDFALGVMLASAAPGCLNRWGNMPLAVHGSILLASVGLVWVSCTDSFLIADDSFPGLIVLAFLSFGIIVKAVSPGWSEKLARWASGSFSCIVPIFCSDSPDGRRELFSLPMACLGVVVPGSRGLHDGAERLRIPQTLFPPFPRPDERGKMTFGTTDGKLRRECSMFTFMAPERRHPVSLSWVWHNSLGRQSSGLPLFHRNEADSPRLEFSCVRLFYQDPVFPGLHLKGNRRPGPPEFLVVKGYLISGRIPCMLFVTPLACQFVSLGIFISLPFTHILVPHWDHSPAAGTPEQRRVERAGASNPTIACMVPSTGE